MFANVNVREPSRYSLISDFRRWKNWTTQHANYDVIVKSVLYCVIVSTPTSILFKRFLVRFSYLFLFYWRNRVNFRLFVCFSSFRVECFCVLLLVAVHHHIIMPIRMTNLLIVHMLRHVCIGMRNGVRREWKSRLRKITSWIE